MGTPLISVLMPARNASLTIREAIVSILLQTEVDFELLVLDDGSEDSTREQVLAISDKRVRLISDGQSLGLPKRLNLGVGMARAPFIARMDADDIAFPSRFEQQMAVLRSRPEVDLTGVRAMLVSDDLRPTGIFSMASSHEELTARPWRIIPVIHSTWLGRATWFKQNPYAVPEHWYAEDQELLLRTYRKCRFFSVPEILFAVRVTRPGLSRLVRARKYQFMGYRAAHPFRESFQGNTCAFLQLATGISIDVASRALPLRQLRDAWLQDQLTDEDRNRFALALAGVRAFQP